MGFENSMFNVNSHTNMKTQRTYNTRAILQMSTKGLILINIKTVMKILKTNRWNRVEPISSPHSLSYVISEGDTIAQRGSVALQKLVLDQLMHTNM